MKNKFLLLFILCVSISTAQTISATYDFENLTLNNNLNGQDGWLVSTNVSQQNIQTTLSVGDYIGSKAFVAGDLGGSNYLFASRVDNESWSLPDYSSCSGPSELIIEASMTRNYWGQLFHLCYDVNEDGDFTNGSSGDVDELGIGFGRNRSGGIDRMLVFKADGSEVQVSSMHNIQTYKWVRFKLVVDLSANSGAGSGTLYFKDLESQGSWTVHTGLENINMGIVSGANNRSNLSKLNGIALRQEADRTSWDDFTISYNCSEVLDLEKNIVAKPIEFSVVNGLLSVKLIQNNNATLAVYDAFGRLVYETAIIENTFSKNMHQSGLYIVKVLNGNDKLTKKVILRN